MLRTSIFNLQRCYQRNVPPMRLGMGIRGHKNFGHKPNVQTWVEIAWHSFLTFGVILPWVFNDWIRQNFIPTYGVYKETETVVEPVPSPTGPS